VSWTLQNLPNIIAGSTLTMAGIALSGGASMNPGGPSGAAPAIGTIAPAQVQVGQVTTPR
jgi:hypothetical protein